jgi:hypothetical protein
MITGINAQRCAEYMKKLQWLDENPVAELKISEGIETRFNDPAQTSGQLKSRLKR